MSDASGKSTASGSGGRDFLTLEDVSREELLALIERAAELKRMRAAGEPTPTLAGKVLGLIFEKASTRTRVSFQVGMFELGGHAVNVQPQGSHIGRGEPISDTARVMGGYCHGIVLRTFGHERLLEAAQWAPVPVINGLTDMFHPCQVGSDLLTVRERLGDVAKVRYAWLGDGNNMANSWINAAGMLGLDLRLACPEGYQPDGDVVAKARARMEAMGRGQLVICTDPHDALVDAEVVSTDVWASMGQEEEARQRAQVFAGYGLDSALLAHASTDAIVLHCLPAYRGKEISAEVFEGPQSAVWQQAENRLHMQKAILEFLLA